MSTVSGTDKEHVAHTYNGILLNHKKEQNNNVICTNMDGSSLEIVIPSEVSQRKMNAM